MQLLLKRGNVFSFYEKQRERENIHLCRICMYLCILYSNLILYLKKKEKKSKKCRKKKEKIKPDSLAVQNFIGFRSG